ncbi:MAG: hypothetical protein M3483_04800, partial [Gemmatimonadota bacterium]|nr:hypothetical protein [Gemmatimonadota bacterium]
AGIGALAGLLVSTRSPSISVPRLAREDRGMNADITREDIVRSGSASVFDVVQSLRPTWLRIRGVSKLGEIGTLHGSPGNEVVIPGEIAIKVYMDGARMGGVESLRQLPAVSVGAIQHFDAAAATLRFGSGHEHGAIVVTTVSAG